MKHETCRIDSHNDLDPGSVRRPSRSAGYCGGCSHIHVRRQTVVVENRPELPGPGQTECVPIPDGIRFRSMSDLFAVKYSLTTAMRPGGGPDCSGRYCPDQWRGIRGEKTGRPAGTPAATNAKPLQIDWSLGTSHRFTFTKFIDSYVQPVVIGELFDVRFSAMEIKTGTTGGSLKQGARPFGRSCGRPGPKTRTTATMACSCDPGRSDRYLFAEITDHYDINEWLALTFGWQHKPLSVNEVKLRSTPASPA